MDDIREENKLTHLRKMDEQKSFLKMDHESIVRDLKSENNLLRNELVNLRSQFISSGGKFKGREKNHNNVQEEEEDRNMNERKINPLSEIVGTNLFQEIMLILHSTPTHPFQPLKVDLAVIVIVIGRKS